MKSDIEFPSSGDPTELIIIYRLCLCSFPAASACSTPYSLFPVQYMTHIFNYTTLLSSILQVLFFSLLLSCFLTSLPVWGWYGAEIISASRCSSDDCKAMHDFNLSPHTHTVDSHSFYLWWKCGCRQGGDATANIANSAHCSAITLIRCGKSCPVCKPLTLSDLQKSLLHCLVLCMITDLQIRYKPS